ncbi:uncharacterized protein HMPREF1541_09730 [Cyphellophora europaea CBS 101466]|uniref:C2H2-type domain-containing protein n=1 Tax=Cyphellophora europaea (strain CBS 101466) TaxID=1220924 RepID=W2S892_CYPE1|nr:uncharacterized protein HMPREF1541_09730 [Cyphellophora europaea CBS 101466]ETN44855.1 hypothetical protein HMPREF1541_09730 [Cyphellophora europaea CBS 101466]
MAEENNENSYGDVAATASKEGSQHTFDAQAKDGPPSKSSARSSSSSSALPPVPQFPPPKTDKPRPHVCTTCMRSFARLEHLKRHERSHTKEKPFACSECTRCFARRDLLLRHQQKLHSTTTPSARPRAGRRESVAGTATAGGPGRVRKNSMASNNVSSMRPRANTLSHVDAATIGMLANTNPAFDRHFVPGHNHHHSLSGMPPGQGFGYRGMTNLHGLGLPKLETGLPLDLSGGLRTAPPYGGFGSDFPMDFSQNQGNTINPHALHMSDMNGVAMEQPFQQLFYPTNMQHGMPEDDGTFDWMARGFENQMTFAQANENAIDDSSPSAMSTNSPTNMQELSAEMQPGPGQHPHLSNAQTWQQAVANNAHMVNSPMSMDFGSTFNEMMPGHNGTISPKSLLAQSHMGLDLNLPTPPDMASLDVTAMSTAVPYNSFQLPLSRDSGTSTASTASHDSSLRQSSITTTSSDLVNENVRNTLIAGLSQSNPFSQRKYSQPLISSPLSPDSGSKTKGFNAATFPSLPDLQRYVSAYIKYYHPHLPFLHIPTLNFESSEYTMPPRFVGGQAQYGQASAAGGGSCLVLSIAAIGAVYEREMDQSRELFQWAHRFIFSYLEMRRKADMHRTQFAPRHASDSEESPLWLVQAMLLHVIYGHNCGDKTAAEVASNHCSSLVSLARDAHLARPQQGFSSRKGSSGQNGVGHPGGEMGGWTSMLNESEEVDWMEWKTTEERKRTLYAVFILSSMLVMAYNHAPALTNSEIRIDLPCDEELWAVDSSQAWQAMGGIGAVSSKSTTFATALSHLLMSSQRQRRKSMSMNMGQTQPEVELKPSTFGCLILVNALHNYIWETRQRHLGRQWTIRDTEQMHAHIEPALRAWEAAWASNPSHSLERPNPFGAGPLSADSVPLLDLAYVRLYINLGRSKEAFWQRDYNSVAEEVARSPDVTVLGEDGRGLQQRRSSMCQVDGQEQGNLEASDELMPNDMSKSQSTRRERQLRRAAFYASDSLLMSDKLGLIFEESNYRELTAQSALCAFDCAQVLSEWVTTVQERVGKYVGVLGQDEADLLQVPGILLLEDEDRQLLGKIEEFIKRTEQKLGRDVNMEQGKGGYSPRILGLTAQLLDRAAVWPVTKLMGQSLETQAVHMRDRANVSVTSA